MGAMVPPSRKSCYNFRVITVYKVFYSEKIVLNYKIKVMNVQ